MLSLVDRGCSPYLATVHCSGLGCPCSALRLVSPVPWRWKHAKLLQEAEHVRFDPLFYKLAVHDAVDLRAGHAHVLPRRCHPLTLSLVREPIGLADDHQVAFRDEELGHRMEREGGQIGGKQVLEGQTASNGSRGRQTTHMHNAV